MPRARPLVLLVLVLAGCASAPPASTPAAAAIDNCGVSVTFEAPPKRVVTIKSTSTEMLLALGVGDRIVGTAFQDGPVPDEWADDAAALTSISDKVPGQEVVLEVEPDLVYAGWESNFSPDGAGERASLQALGIDTYVSPAACKEPDYQPEKLDFDQIFGEIEEVASIFGVDASELVDEQRAELATITPLTGEHTALWFSSGSDTPYVGAGIGAPELLLETIGLENIAASIADTWAPFNWEAVVDADPDVIVLVDASWNTAVGKIGILESNPATAKLSAVVNERYLIVPFPASEAGVRSVSAAVDLSEQLAALGLPPVD